MLLYDTERVQKAEQDPWFERRNQGGKNSQAKIPQDHLNKIGALRTITPAPLDTQENAYEQREAVAQVQHMLGVPTQQIAKDLGVTEATVRRYLRSPEQRARETAKLVKKGKELQDNVQRARKEETARQQQRKKNTGPGYP